MDDDTTRGMRALAEGYDDTARRALTAGATATEVADELGAMGGHPAYGRTLSRVERATLTVAAQQARDVASACYSAAEHAEGQAARVRSAQEAAAWREIEPRLYEVLDRQVRELLDE